MQLINTMQLSPAVCSSGGVVQSAACGRRFDSAACIISPLCEAFGKSSAHSHLAMLPPIPILPTQTEWPPFPPCHSQEMCAFTHIPHTTHIAT